VFSSRLISLAKLSDTTHSSPDVRSFAYPDAKKIRGEHQPDAPHRPRVLAAWRNRRPALRPGDHAIERERVAASRKRHDAEDEDFERVRMVLVSEVVRQPEYVEAKDRRHCRAHAREQAHAAREERELP
jgi:hypothetical protein